MRIEFDEEKFTQELREKVLVRLEREVNKTIERIFEMERNKGEEKKMVNRIESDKHWSEVHHDAEGITVTIGHNNKEEEKKVSSKFYVVPVLERGENWYDDFIVLDPETGEVKVSSMARGMKVSDVDFIYGFTYRTGDLVQVAFTEEELSNMDSRYKKLARPLPEGYRLADWMETEFNDVYYKVVVSQTGDRETVLYRNRHQESFKTVPPVNYVLKGRDQYAFTRQEIENINPDLMDFATPLPVGSVLYKKGEEK